MLRKAKIVEIWSKGDPSKLAHQVNWQAKLIITIFFNFKGCPNVISIAHADTESNIVKNENVLHDNCEEDSSEWLAPEGAVDDDAELILNLGCPQILTVVQIKNLKRGLGGTKKITLYAGNDLTGPWKFMTSAELNQTEGCSDEMKILKFTKG